MKYYAAIHSDEIHCHVDRTKSYYIKGNKKTDKNMYYHLYVVF